MIYEKFCKIWLCQKKVVSLSCKKKITTLNSVFEQYEL